MLAYEATRQPVTHALISALEHASVRLPAEKFLGPRRRVFPACRDGTADLAALETALKRADVPIGLVSLMAVNNETGVIQPIHEAR